MTTGRINQVAILQTTQHPPVQNTRQMMSSRIQRTGSRRFKPEGAQAETRSVFSTNVETRASRQVSRALRSGHDQIDASPVAFLLFSLSLPAQSDIRETQRGSTRGFTRGHNRRLGLGARPDPRSVASTKSTHNGDEQLTLLTQVLYKWDIRDAHSVENYDATIDSRCEQASLGHSSC